MTYSLSPERYKRIEYLNALITLGANLAGALITSFYLAAINPIPTGSVPVIRTSLGDWVYAVVGVLVLLALGSWVGERGNRYLPAWYERLRKGESYTAMPEQARREVLQVPPLSGLTSLAMWFLAAIFLGYLPTSSWQAFFAIFGVGGIITSAIVYFALDTVWRQAVPHFFPDGRLSAVQAGRISVRRRLVLTFVMTSLYPLTILAVTVLSRAEALRTADNPAAIITNLYIAVGFITLIGLGASIALAILVAHSIVDPLLRLQDAMTQVAQNNLATQIQVDSNDELGYVTERFNDMVVGLRQGEMMRNLLNLYVSPEVARAALAEGGAQLGGQVVESTILFSDIRGFTSLSERLPPQELISLLNRYMSCMVDVIITNGGIVNKFGGDSLLAIFGTPLNPADDHAACAIRAALHMRRALVRFNADQEKTGGPVLNIGIGVACGPVVAGNVGGLDRIEYTVIGDTVNLAARLQGLTKDLGREILVNALVVEQATRSMSLAAEPLQPVNVRGKAEPVKVFALISEL